MRKLKYLTFTKIFIVLFFLLNPKKHQTYNTYQNSLFTTKGKIDRNNEEFGGITFKFGGYIEDIKPWERYRIGYPLKATTIDHQKESKITQGRIEIDAVLVNLLFAAISIILITLIIRPPKTVTKAIINSKIFHHFSDN